MNTLLAEAARPIRVFDGYVRLTRVMAEIEEDGCLTATSDLSTINDARASFAKSSSEFGGKEQAIMDMLSEGGHTSPFRGTIVQVEVECPLMIARQWYKYACGSDVDESLSVRDPFFAWNEVSRRYVTRSPKMFTPGDHGWREKAETHRQGSGDVLPCGDVLYWQSALEQYQADGVRFYKDAISEGICPEQARLFLPAYGLYVTFRWTFSLQAGCHVIRQRKEKGAQDEWTPYADALNTILTGLYPKAVAALNPGVVA